MVIFYGRVFDNSDNCSVLHICQTASMAPAIPALPSTTSVVVLGRMMNYATFWRQKVILGFY
uniref:Uncharacterized protein n=1 Tax=Oryza brachyantha TaxID=4533 RepID=J3LEF9_ORYBR